MVYPHPSLNSTESVPRQKEGSTGKYQHEVEETPETECWYFPVLPNSSQGTEIPIPIYKSDEALAIVIAMLNPEQ